MRDPLLAPMAALGPGILLCRFVHFDVRELAHLLVGVHVLIVVRGTDPIGNSGLETLSLLQYSQVAEDELFVTAASANLGITVTKRSGSEYLVIRKPFWPKQSRRLAIRPGTRIWASGLATNLRVGVRRSAQKYISGMTGSNAL